MAGSYPSAWLDELRARADIVKIVSSYVPLKKNGHRYTGLCPFHNEKTPSFSVDEQKQLYYCFGCKAGGSVIQFVMEIERLSFQEAVAFLADQLHMPLPEMRHDPGYEQRRTLKERIHLANQAAARLYHQQLWTEGGQPILAYLQQRGLSDAVIRRFGIGAASGGLNVGKELQAQGFTQEELIAAGLVLNRSGRVFDMFRDRAMFPIIDAYGQVLGFGGRAMGQQMPKYLNTSDTPAFNKRYNVYAANLLRKAKNLKRVLLVEGYMDVVALSQFGVTGMAATLGTALTPEQARLLHRYAPEVHVCYDGDSAGQHAILRALDILEAESIPAQVLDLPGGQDPDEYVREHGVEAFEALEPMAGTAYRMLRQKDGCDMSTEDGRISYAKACAGILKAIREPVELDRYVKRLALETGISADVLQEQIGVTPAKQHTIAEKREGFRQTAREASALDMDACTLLAVLATGRLPEGTVKPEAFADPALRALCERMLAGESPAAILEAETEPQSRATLSKILAINTDEEDTVLMAMAEQSLLRTRQSRLEAELDALQKSLPHLPPEEQTIANQRAYALTKQLMELH